MIHHFLSCESLKHPISKPHKTVVVVVVAAAAVAVVAAAAATAEVVAL